MHAMKRVLAGAGLIVLAGVPVLFADETTTRAQRIEQVEEATSRHIEVLTDVLARVPEQARSGLEKAIVASQRGHDAALGALTRARAEDQSAATTRGLERARARVEAAFGKSIDALNAVIGKVPERAVDHVRAALDRVGGQRHVALENLDRLIAGLRPDRAAATPERPERPDRPQTPERPAAPERPARPETPERPAPPVTGD